MPATTFGIQHSYQGYTLRSRVEFAWAQEFDARGLAWEYEPTTFRADEGSYTPDFALDGGAVYIETKVWGGRNVHNRFHLCRPPLLLIFGLPNKCYIRVKPADAETFLPARLASFALAYNLARRVAA